MSEHTKRPWMLFDCRGAIDPYISIVAVQPAKVIASIRGKESNQLLNAENFANARLIAAAPQLLTACKQLLPLLPYWSIDIEDESQVDEIQKAIEELEAAVKAAEGGK